MLNLAEYKRRQAAPGVKVTLRNFGRDRRYPIVNRFRDPGTPLPAARPLGLRQGGAEQRGVRFVADAIASLMVRARAMPARLEPWPRANAAGLHPSSAGNAGPSMASSRPSMRRQEVGPTVRTRRLDRVRAVGGGAAALADGVAATGCGWAVPFGSGGWLDRLALRVDLRLRQLLGLSPRSPRYRRARRSGRRAA